MNIQAPVKTNRWVVPWVNKGDRLSNQMKGLGDRLRKQMMWWGNCLFCCYPVWEHNG